MELGMEVGRDGAVGGMEVGIWGGVEQHRRCRTDSKEPRQAQHFRMHPVPAPLQTSSLKLVLSVGPWIQHRQLPGSLCGPPEEAELSDRAVTPHAGPPNHAAAQKPFHCFQASTLPCSRQAFVCD